MCIIPHIESSANKNVFQEPLKLLPDRLNVVLSKSVLSALKELAHREEKSLSVVAQELIAEALDRHEDLFLSDLAMKRESESKRTIPHLPKAARNIIKKAIEERLTIDPIGLGKPLRYSLKGHRRLRVGDYRGVFRIDGERRVLTITVIKHRKDVYDE